VWPGSSTHRPRLQRDDIQSPQKRGAAGATPYLRTPARYDSRSFVSNDQLQEHPREKQREQRARDEQALIELDAETSDRAQGLLEQSDLRSARAAKDMVPRRQGVRHPSIQAPGTAVTNATGITASSARSADLERMIKVERDRRLHAERELLHTLATLSGSQRHTTFSMGDIQPIKDLHSGLQGLTIGRQMKDMYRPPTGDIKEDFRQGIPTLGIKNLMWHGTSDAGLGTTHGTHRKNRFLSAEKVPYGYVHDQGCGDTSHMLPPEFE